jgi:phytoene dehydrogenase-like protein
MFPEHSVKPAFIKRIKAQSASFSFAISYFGVEWDDVPSELRKANCFHMENSKYHNFRDYWIMYLEPEKSSEKKKALSVVEEVNPADFRQFMENPEETGDAYRKVKKDLMARHEKMLYDMYPEFRGKVIPLDVSTPVSYERITGTPDGAIYGLARSVKTRNLGPRASLGGLYLSGQSLIPGILGVAISSLFACVRLLDMEQVWSDIKTCR